MEYEWDPGKAAANAAKHGVSFEAIHEFDWDAATTSPDLRRNYGEERILALGPINGIIHLAVFTNRDGKIRLISLRRANDRERRNYERT
jgi:uncharacterized DUF497 family protein